MTFPKVGKTNGENGEAVNAWASAAAKKTGQNGFRSTFKAEAASGASAPPHNFGVYSLYVEVTDKLPKLKTKAFFLGEEPPAPRHPRNQTNDDLSNEVRVCYVSYCQVA